MRALLAQGPFIATLGEHDVAWFGGGDVARALGLPGDGQRSITDDGPLRFVAIGPCTPRMVPHGLAERFDLGRPFEPEHQKGPHLRAFRG